MSKAWKLTINNKLYNIDKFIEDHNKIMYASRGKARMINLPKIGDIVYVVCGGRIRMSCTVVSDFIIGNLHQTDKYNKGLIRKHSETELYITLRVDTIMKNYIQCKGNMRTWTLY